MIPNPRRQPLVRIADRLDRGLRALHAQTAQVKAADAAGWHAACLARRVRRAEA
jgi:hypothetical protein